MAIASNRSEPYLATWLHSRGGAAGIAVSGTFELTPRCNFHCPMCYICMDSAQAKQIGTEVTASQWIDLARQAQAQGMMFALLTGGEPFLRKDFFEIYEAMREMGLMISINSNGSMLDGEIREKLLQNPPNRMNISLYGGSRETYRNMCGQDCFDRVVNNIRALKEGGVDIRLNLSITPYNCQDLQEIYAISKELNLNIKATSYMYPPIRKSGSQPGCCNRLSPEKAAKYGVEWDLLRFTPEQFSQRAENMQSRISFDRQECGLDPDTGVGCRAGFSSFWLTWDGKMLPCNMMPVPTANPLEVGFCTAWDEIRAKTREIHTPDKCASCDKRALCAVCAAVCITETGSYDQVPDYLCRHTEETIRATWEAYQENYKNENQEKGY